METEVHGIRFGGTPPPPRVNPGKYAEVWVWLRENPGEWASKTFGTESRAQGFKQTMKAGAEKRGVGLEVASRRDSGTTTIWFRVQE